MLRAADHALRHPVASQRLDRLGRSRVRRHWPKLLVGAHDATPLLGRSCSARLAAQQGLR
ncbi:MAG: hypothetical protein AVDCRST_MAG10-1705 [uncultured Acidimicrobiales bacterium]|uniref:Uncharacterized protein n=1 Tax=uncultured Acidimicrobiales bacterium TaxID=310071 RepID=A0A6J4I5W3_9ACTN|nr:MAG: hypothetical protein AVDCRST_MAG10-1705 [uncultured Acidimicrobiales bacterium]